MNDSSTWQPNGFGQLPNERNLDIYANALYGNDTIGLGMQGSESPTLDNQGMAVIRTEKIWDRISLTRRGGHDQSRFTSNNMTFSFAPDTDRDLVVGINAMDQDGTRHDVLPTGINAYVDPPIAQIWIPLEAYSSQQKLLSVRPVNGSISAVDQQGETNEGMIIGIAVGVAVAVILISGGVAAVSIIRYRKRKQKGSKGMVKGTDNKAERIRQGIAKAELDTDPNHGVYEMGQSGIDPDAGTSQSLVDGELKYPASHVELMGGRMMAR
ncbi:MAG: hypothetical protein Q9215_006245 [Flavoplaca cf. flavocitrina]